jgi:hypothetical protein
MEVGKNILHVLLYNLVFAVIQLRLRYSVNLEHT